MDLTFQDEMCRDLSFLVTGFSLGLFIRRGAIMRWFFATCRLALMSLGFRPPEKDEMRPLCLAFVVIGKSCPVAICIGLSFVTSLL